MFVNVNVKVDVNGNAEGGIRKAEKRVSGISNLVLSDGGKAEV